MNSLILSTATRFVAPLMLAYSLFILLRGHDEPGGGFIGGLIAATAFCLYAKAEGTAAARRALRIDPATVSLAGVGVAVAAGVLGWADTGHFLASVWPLVEFDAAGNKAGGVPFGSAALFDTGVYLVVVGAIAGLFLALEEDASRVADPAKGGED